MTDGDNQSSENQRVENQPAVVLLFERREPFRYFTDLALLYDQSPMLIIAAIVDILQEFLMIFHKVNVCGIMLPAGKGREK